MGSYKRVGGAIVPEQFRDKANAVLESGGYGPNMFSVPLGTKVGGGITHYACYMPFDVPTFTSVELVIEQYGGEWIPEGKGQPEWAGAEPDGSPEAKRRFLANLKARGLAIKRARHRRDTGVTRAKHVN